MHKAIVVLDKYSDWLEVYSALKPALFKELTIYTFKNNKTEKESLLPVFQSFLKEDVSISYIQSETFIDLVESVKREIFSDTSTGLLIAPFIRYRHLWALVPLCRKQNIETVHISECLPDTFGPVNYRIAFRGAKLKSWLTLPFAAMYALMHKPDKCYFPLYPYISNPFVKKTEPVLPPALLPEKFKAISDLTGGENRMLLLGGFGYDVVKMAAYLKIEKYIATSKGLEIIIDGKFHPLDQRICAEEVLLSGCVSSVTGYNGSTMAWAKLLYPDMAIDCYESLAFNRQYGPYFNKFSIRALNKLGIKVKPECKEMLTE